ncbi:MAG: RbsD/FucU family protein [Rhizobiaceae bacterium]
MLKGLSPILGPDLLFALRSMGHGDEIAIVDGNYPAVADAQRLIRADGHNVSALLEAILSVMTLDDMVPEAAFTPHTEIPQPCHSAFQAIVHKHEPKVTLTALRGQAFYDRVKNAFAVVASSETALYGNIVLRKGVIYPQI